MNDEKLVEHMIEFIEEKEREAQLEELKSSKSKTKVVDAVLQELGKLIKDED